MNDRGVDGGRLGSPGRVAHVVRETRETRVDLRIDLDAPDPSAPLNTGVPFFDHMLDALRTHGRLGLSVEATGDLHVDAHHLVEDTGIALGTALREALVAGGDGLRIRRYGHAYAPLDESLARAVVDVCDRPYLYWGVRISRARVGDFDTDLCYEFFHALARNGRLTLHLDLLRGTNAHHEIESLFKATAMALRHSLALDTSATAVPSTKGTIRESQARATAHPLPRVEESASASGSEPQDGQQ